MAVREDEGVLARSCRRLQLAPRGQPAGVLNNSQTSRSDMVGMRNLETSVSHFSSNEGEFAGSEAPYIRESGRAVPSVSGA